MVEQSKAAGAKVLLLGMKIPPNYGERYTTAFAAVYPKVAEATEAALVPFMLEGVGGRPDMTQQDGIHPNVQAQPYLLDNVWPVLKPLL
jgi:acyl-CoA thioesterase-1